MTFLAVAIAGATGAIIGYVVEDHTHFPPEQLGRRLFAAAIRSCVLGFFAALVLIHFVFTDTSGGEILADLASGYICGDVAAAVLRRSEQDDGTERPSLVQPIIQAVAGCAAMLLGAAAALTF